MNKTRIAHIALNTAVGGLERLLVEFARCANRERFDLSFVSLAARGPIANEIEALGWPVQAYGKRDGLRPGLILRLARYLRQARPDVVHTHNSAALFYGVIAAKLARVPNLVHTRHGRSFARSGRQTLALKLLARRVDHFVSVSADSHQLSLSQGVSQAGACTILNGVDLTRFSYTQPQSPGAAVVVARLCPEKDLGSLLQAIKLLSRMLPGPRPLLQIVGDGPERGPLEQFTRELGLATAVTFVGERHDIPEQLASASMFVLSSLTEGVSLTLLEAMARGLPVIATRVGGNPEVVVHGTTGLLVPPSDPSALAEAMLRLHRQPDLAREMGLQGRMRVEQMYSIVNMVEAYERLYLAGAAASR